ncbi:MAG: glycosyltransferase family 4 protein, partial [Gaiellaceae bacterium]
RSTSRMPARPRDRRGAVLHVTSEYPPVHFGGLGTAVAGLTRAQREAGLDVGVLLVAGGAYGYGYGYGYAGQGWPALASSHTGEDVVRASYTEGPAVGPGVAAAREARILHLHSSWLWPVAAAIRDATGVPIVYTAHSVDRAEVEHGEWLPHGSIQDRVFAEADRVVVLSESEREYVLRHFPHLRDRVSVVGNGIHLVPAVTPRRHCADGAVVLYVGRFGTRKGVRDVIEAVPRVGREVPGARFVFVGGASPADGPLDAAAWVPPRLRAHLGRMTFLGWSDAPPNVTPPWYAGADVLVVPSRYEPFGMVVLEGMLSGQAIVAAEAGGPGEILRHERTALLYPPGDVDALAAALVRVLRDPGLGRSLGAAAREEARARWAWPRVLPGVERAYAQAAWSRDRARRRSTQAP